MKWKKWNWNDRMYLVNNKEIIDLKENHWNTHKQNTNRNDNEMGNVFWKVKKERCGSMWNTW